MFEMNIESILPSLDYCICLQNEHWRTIVGDFSDSSLDFKEVNMFIRNLRSESLWLDYNAISSDIKRRNLQLDLLGHTNEPVLLIKLKDESEVNENSIYLIKFKLYETSENIFYGKDQKYLIEQIIKLWINSLNFKPTTVQEKYLDFKYIVVNQSNKIDQLNENLSNYDFIVYKCFYQLFLSVIKNNLQPGQKISFTKETIDWFKNYSGGIDALEKQINDAFEMAKALYPTLNEIVIKDYYFMPEVEEQVFNPLKSVEMPQAQPLRNNDNVNDKAHPPIRSITGLPLFNKAENSINAPKDGSTRLEKTSGLLDRYEKAVQKLLAESSPVLGKNIAGACEPPISAPALTDSINKHKERISQCLQLFPDKWPLLRSHYQVIRNLIAGT